MIYQCDDSCSSCWREAREANDLSPIRVPTKMIKPLLLVRVKKANDKSCLWISGGDAVAFEQIAMFTESNNNSMSQITRLYHNQV